MELLVLGPICIIIYSIGLLLEMWMVIDFGLGAISIHSNQKVGIGKRLDGSVVYYFAVSTCMK